jgi:hypothetical protein
MLTKEECQAIGKQAHGRVWLEHLAVNDARLVLFDEDDNALHIWMSAEYDKEEQAQAARLCAYINDEWRVAKRREAEKLDHVAR